jgi:uncharacterized protein YegJ (DUF2314 family)
VDVNEPFINSRRRPNRWRIAAIERGITLPPFDDHPPELLPEPHSTAPSVPIAGLPDDDPQLRAAVAEANGRFDEFLLALSDRGPTDLFAVKAPFIDDFGREYMWVAVSNVDGSHIYGKLDNEPATVRTVRRGQPVRVPLSLLNDWLYVRGCERAGGFTVRLIEQRLRNDDAA